MHCVTFVSDFVSRETSEAEELEVIPACPVRLRPSPSIALDVVDRQIRVSCKTPAAALSRGARPSVSAVEVEDWLASNTDNAPP